MSLPVLGGKTPRQACQTEPGRRKVATLIRTIPQPVGNTEVNIEVPREEMLRLLGLESQQPRGQSEQWSRISPAFAHKAGTTNYRPGGTSRMRIRTTRRVWGVIFTRSAIRSGAR